MPEERAFADPRGLRKPPDVIGSAAAHHLDRKSSSLDSGPAATAAVSSDLGDAQSEIIRLRDQLEIRKQSFNQFYEVLRSVASTLDSQQTYDAVLAKFSEMMGAERCSLMILNEESNELALEAALGASLDGTMPIRVKLGEPIAGAVLASGAAMLVQDAEMTHGAAGQPVPTRPGSSIFSDLVRLRKGGCNLTPGALMRTTTRICVLA